MRVDGVRAVGDDILGRLVDLMPLFGRLDVDGADIASCPQQPVDEVTADESAATGDEYRHGIVNLQDLGRRDLGVTHIVTQRNWHRYGTDAALMRS